VSVRLRVAALPQHPLATRGQITHEDARAFGAFLAGEGDAARPHHDIPVDPRLGVHAAAGTGESLELVGFHVHALDLPVVDVSPAVGENEFRAGEIRVMRRVVAGDARIHAPQTERQAHGYKLHPARFALDETIADH